jgi:eukaryotic-like serine/threonine-protein kinase
VSWPPGDGEPRGRRGEVIASRYQLDLVIGKGAFGEVWAAQDLISGRTVAVKLLRAEVDLELSRAQLEILALQQGPPGVVELLDDGSEDGRAFLVMELVDGKPFPGRDPPCAWADVADVVVALLSTLSRVHAAFVVHCDLKPANVLVTRDRQVKLLDFGISHTRAHAESRGRYLSDMDGTPAYMAPEQLRGGPLTERTDIYALGVMLYEILSGRLPHQGANPGQLLYARLNRPPIPLAQVAPDVPPNVAGLVDRMLALDPAARPASASDVLAVLRGEHAIEQPLFPWLGPQTALLSVLKAAEHRRSLDVLGPKGHGKTRVLLAAKQVLSASRAVHWIQPVESGEPFACLRPLIGPLPSEGDASEMARLASEAVRSAAQRGDVLLVDDFEQLDPWSQTILNTVRSDGTLIRTLGAPRYDDTGAVVLAPLEEADLRSLFAGPDRLLHLREDAARLLYQRTHGVPASVVREVSEWLSLGITKWTRSLLVVSRSALDRLSAGLLGGESLPGDAAPYRDLAPPCRDTLLWTSLSWPHTTIPLLAELSGRSQADVQADVEALSAEGMVRILPDRRVVAQVPQSYGDWSEAQVRAAHAAIAKVLPPGAPSRLHHLLLADARDDAARLAVAREAAALATRRIEEGRVGEAIASIESGLRAVRGLDPAAAAETCDLLGLWAEAALEEGTPHAVSRLLHALYRAKPHARLDVVESLALAMKIQDFGSDRAMSLTATIPPLTDARLERLRVRVLMQAVHLRENDGAEEELLDTLSRSEIARDQRVAARIEHARGRLRYRQGRFLESAALHESAAARAGPVLHRIEAMCAAAWAFIEAFELDRARSIAEQARALAAQHRHAIYETYATWSLRAIDYRKREAEGPDMDLAGAVQYAVGRRVQGAILFTEAAAAWRSGHPEALRMAEASWLLLSGVDEKRGKLLMRCLMIALGARVDPGEIAALHETALGFNVAGIGVQALGLLALGDRLICEAVGGERLVALAHQIPRACWDTPVDILSVNESLEAIRKACPEQSTELLSPMLAVLREGTGPVRAASADHRTR